MAPDALLTDADREEALSWAFVRAVAGFAGYTISVEDFDRNGVDLFVHAGQPLSPAVGLQLKATVNLGAPGPDGNYRYAVPVANYRRLIRRHNIPRYLVVLALPSDHREWLVVSDDELVLRRCAYWVSLAGLPESENHATVTVSIPAENRFDPDALQRLLEQARG